MSIVEFTMYARVCPVCGTAASEELYANPDFRYIIAQGDIYVAPLRYAICDHCAHIYKNPNIDTSEMQVLYQQHYNENPGAVDSQRLKQHYAAFSQLMDPFLRDSAKPQTVLEIGCGNGALLKNIYQHYRPHIANVKGIEPSISLYNYLVSEGYFDYENIFFDELALDQSYDLIIMDNVFEHFDQPFDELLRVKQILTETGVLYISIPNIKINLSGYVDMFAGHPSNYLLENLALLLDRAGFQVAKHAYNNLWLNCVVRHKQPQDTLPTYDFAQVKADLLQLIRAHLRLNIDQLGHFQSHLNHEIQAMEQQGGKLVIFGAGNHTQELLNHVDFKTSISCLIDNNPELQGHSRLGYPVRAPGDLKELDFAKVLISSKSFQEDMRQTLLGQGLKPEQIICLYD